MEPSPKSFYVYPSEECSYSQEQNTLGMQRNMQKQSPIAHFRVSVERERVTDRETERIKWIEKTERMKVHLKELFFLRKLDIFSTAK